jgi:hypothetical protein
MIHFDTNFLIQTIAMIAAVAISLRGKTGDQQRR